MRFGKLNTMRPSASLLKLRSVINFGQKKTRATLYDVKWPGAKIPDPNGSWDHEWTELCGSAIGVVSLADSAAVSCGAHRPADTVPREGDIKICRPTAFHTGGPRGTSDSPAALEDRGTTWGASGRERSRLRHLRAGDVSLRRFWIGEVTEANPDEMLSDRS